MSSVREFFRTPAGRYVAIGLSAVGLLVVLLTLRGVWSGGEAQAASRERAFISSATGETFEYELKAGDTIPVRAPDGSETGYPAEWCFWAPDGTAKDAPTPVLLNAYAGKDGPTFCPDCDRLVVGHNPRPGPGVTPPPTRNDYKAPRKNKEARNDR